MIRFALFLVIEAGVAWFVLSPIWAERDSTTKDRVWRTVAGMVAGGMCIAAFSDATAKSYYQCTQEAGHGDETECVGDYERVAGPNYGGAFVWTIVATIALRVSLDKPDDSNTENR